MTLFEAVETGLAELVRETLSSGGDVNVIDRERKTPLIHAAGLGHLAVVEVLLEAGAEPEWRDVSDETALLKAAANGHGEVAQRLAGTASEDDQHLAESFLKAFGASHGPEYQYDVSRMHKGAVTLAARAANFVGVGEPLARVERQNRAEAEVKKK
jgi:hypothetical protein